MGINTLWVFIRKEGYSFKKASAKHIQGDAEAQEQFKKTAELSKKNLISASCILIKADLGFIRTKEKAGSPIQEDRGFFY